MCLHGRNIFSLIILVFVTTQVFTSCRKKVNQQPVIDIILPTENNSFNYDEILNVELLVNDDESGNLVSLKLKEISTGNYMEIYDSKRTTQLREKISFTLDLGEMFFSGGQYMLIAGISDEEYSNYDYRQIQISSSPNQVQYIFAASALPYTTILQKADTSLLFNPFLTVQGDLKAIAGVAPDALFYSSSVFGWAGCVHPSTGAILWQHAGNGNSTPYFTSYYTINEKTYVGFREGRVNGYDASGHPFFGCITGPDYFPVETVVNATYLVNAESSFIGGSNRMKVYNSGNATALKEFSHNLDIKALFNGRNNDEIGFIAEQSGNIIWGIYHVGANNMTILNQISTCTFHDICYAGNYNYLLATSQFVYNLNVYQSQLSVIPGFNDISCLVSDTLTSTHYFGFAQSVRRLNNSFVQTGYFTLSNPVNDLALVYAH